VVDVCRKYIPNVLAKCPSEPSMTKAVIWCWYMAETPYVFHLEDDWLIKRPTSMNRLVKILSSDPELSSVRLCKYKLPGGKKFALNQHVVYDHQGEDFYICRLRDQFSLNPTLIRRDFIREALPHMVPDENPEKQFRLRNPRMCEVMQRWKVAMYGRPRDAALVVDNGLKWRNNRGLKKGGKKPEDFTTWSKQ